MKIYLSEMILFEVVYVVEEEIGVFVQSFQINFLWKIFEVGVDFGLILKEVGFVFSVVIIVNQVFVINFMRYVVSVQIGSDNGGVILCFES